MFYAIDGFFRKIHAKDAIPGNRYQCPLCGEEMYVRGGNKTVIHFSHKKNTCIDDWIYDTSGWSIEIQNMFESDCREIVVEHNGEKHYADILKNDIVLLFANQKIRAHVFDRRTKFFMSAGYKVAWVFNVTEQAKEKLICEGHFVDPDKRLYAYKWNHAPRFFKNAPIISENNKNFAIWFWTDQYTSHLERVVWSDKDQNGYNFKQFHVHTSYIDFLNPINVNDFFKSSELQNPKHKELNKSESKFPKKYVGEKGHKRDDYMCPRKRQPSWIQIFGDRGCLYCKNCESITQRFSGGDSIFEVRCAYPDVVQPIISNNRDRETKGIKISKKQS